MLRGVNLAGNRRLKMEDLRAVFESAGLANVRTYLQSGNVIFTTEARDLARLAARLERAVERKCGFRSAVILRTIAEMRDAVARNPFTARSGLDPARLLVTFLARDPGEAARDKVRGIRTHPEELHIAGGEFYVYYPSGIGRSRLPVAAIERALATEGTARNWNTVTRLIELAERLEKSSP
jgi:uncharacterized protein (DUF1697 family)